MTYGTKYKITDIKSQQSFIVNSSIYENVELMAVGLEDRFTVEVIRDLMSCHSCGQGLIPFKKGVCMCGMQVGSIQYVNNPERFAENQYCFYVGTSKVEKLGIAEMMDN
ncbi:MAG: hypothetical protein OEM28_12400 [Nitrosopumilus sp.]|nr:hypothetical protein [Nitrosopumilus sp.]